MATVIANSLAGYADEHGGRCHDLLGTRCDPYVRKMLSKENEDCDFTCHSNLTRAVVPWGLTEYDIHDVLNIFQVTGLVDGRYYMAPCPARGGRIGGCTAAGTKTAEENQEQEADYIEFFAEIDLLVALSTCPGGDLSCCRFQHRFPDANLRRQTNR